MSETLVKCRVCGAELLFSQQESSKPCRFCKSVNVRPQSVGETLNIFNLATEQRLNKEFFHAEESYRRVLEIQKDEYEARWGLVLCKYGIEYMQDAKSGRSLPICHIVQAKPMREDPDYKQACKLAPADVRAGYEKDAAYIDATQQKIRQMRKNEPGYDIFLCYKETALESKEPTQESRDARRLYNELTRGGYRVFFAPESLPEMAGENYEAGIYHAIETARVMLVIGRNPEHLTSRWVQSEWSRFLARMDDGEEKYLLPLYGGISYEQLPKAFEYRGLQGLSMDRPAWNLELNSVLLKLIPPKPAPVSSPAPTQPAPAPAGARTDGAGAERPVKPVKPAKNLRTLIVAVAVLGVLLVAGLLLMNRPAGGYQQAVDLYRAGDYAGAREAFSALGGQRDAAAWAELSGAMAALENGSPEEAEERLERLTAGGLDGASTELRGELKSLMTDWQKRGLPPQCMLTLLDRAALIDPESTLDTATLNIDAHVALLEGPVLLTYTDDVNGDGAAELIALGADDSVSVYQMTATGNRPMPVDKSTAAGCLVRFGQMIDGDDVDGAIRCYAAALEQAPNDGAARAGLAAAYRSRYAANRHGGNMPAAIGDARLAMETSGLPEDFDTLYDVALDDCTTDCPPETALTKWEAFREENADAIARFGAEERWKADAAQMHLNYAAQLAGEQDARCADELRAAWSLGADITEPLARMEASAGPGLPLARLRLVELDAAAGDAAQERQIREAMTGEVRTAIGAWQAYGIDPTDVPALIRFADEQGMDLTDLDWRAAYRDAALTMIGDARQVEAVDWNRDGYEEFVALGEDGTLSLYEATEAGGVVASANTRLPSASFAVAGEETPLVLVVSAGRDELLVLAWEDGALTALFREQNVSRVTVQGTTVTFFRALEGSIRRDALYTYEVTDAANRPVRTGIDWQQSDYPQPGDGAAAVLRYFEAKAYGIAEEMACLTAQPDGVFSPELLAALEAPKDPRSIAVSAYLVEDERVCLEVSYEADGGRVRAWIECVDEDGWKLVGAMEALVRGQALADVDDALPLLCLNAEEGHAAVPKGEKVIYRVLLPEPGKIYFIWQAGEKDRAQKPYRVWLYRDSLASEPVIFYDFEHKLAAVQTHPLFMPAGVYYVVVESLLKEAPDYHMTMKLQPNANVELERNDTIETATPVALNTTYAGSLLKKEDVDFFTFRVEEPSQVNVTLHTAGTESKARTVYVMAVSTAVDAPLATVEVPGNAQLTQTGSLYLGPGTYLVKISKGSSHTPTEYGLTVSATPSGLAEAEYNNTLATANEIPVNADVQGSFGQEKDIDYFTFTLDGDAVIQPRLTFAPTDSTSTTYVMTIFGTNNQVLQKINFGGKETSKVVIPLALPAGQYAIRLENPRFVRQEYTLRVVSKPVNAAEREPNDTLAHATALPLGETVTGVLTSKDDIDYYKVTIDEDNTEVTIHFAFKAREGTNERDAFAIILMRDGTTSKMTLGTVKANTGYLDVTMTCKKGEYYLQVKPVNWISEEYTMTVQTE